MLLCAALALAGVNGGAHAAPAAEAVAPVVVVVVLPPPGLAEAIETAVAAWQVRIVVASSTGRIDREQARELAATHGAQRVVWVHDDTLIVYDAASGMFDHRAAPPAPLADAEAAAAALTIKTMLRLAPPPGPGDTAPAPPTPRSPPPEAHRPWAVVVAVGLGVPLDGDAATHPRLRLGGRRAFGALVLGVDVDLALATEVTGSSGFEGTWRDVGTRAGVAWQQPLGGLWELWVGAGLGLVASSVKGRVAGEAVDEASVAVAAGAGSVVGWRRWRLLTPLLLADLEARSASAEVERPNAGTVREVFASPLLQVTFGLGLAIAL